MSYMEGLLYRSLLVIFVNVFQGDLTDVSAELYSLTAGRRRRGGSQTLKKRCIPAQTL